MKRADCFAVVDADHSICLRGRVFDAEAGRCFNYDRSIYRLDRSSLHFHCRRILRGRLPRISRSRPILMTPQPTAQIDTSAALRHAVYRDLLSMLPIASYRQAQRFAANLALCRNTFNLWERDYRKRRRAIDAVMLRLLLLRVSPDIAEADTFRGWPLMEIESNLADKYGERLRNIAGFYFDNRWRVNLPEGCAINGYRSREGFYAGVLCQPLDRIDYFFLLSSRGQGGFSPMRMTDADRKYFERFKEPVELPPEAEAFRRSIPPLDLTGYEWTGRRFREVRK